MQTYMFEVAHGYQILKGYIDSRTEEEAREQILDEQWDDIIDEFDKDEFTEGYEIIDIWL